MKRLLLVFILALGLASAQEIDLLAGTLDGVPICESSLDDVIGVLGRPSAVKGPRTFLSIEVGSELSWHPLGLSFAFELGSVAGEEFVRSLQVRLSRVWDSDHSEWFQVFPGALSPTATANWRVQDSLEALEAFEPSERTVEDVRREMSAAGVRESALPTSAPHIVQANLSPGSSVFFRHEPVTRFLEAITYRCFVDE